MFSADEARYAKNIELRLRAGTTIDKLPIDETNNEQVP